jgi:hypothetical protein
MSFTSGEYILIIIIIFAPGIVGLFFLLNNKDKKSRFAVGIGLILISALFFLGFKATYPPRLPDRCLFYNESFSCKEFKILDDNGLGHGVLTFKIRTKEINATNFGFITTEPYNSEISICNTITASEMVSAECFFNQKFQPGDKMMFDINGTYTKDNVTLSFVGLIYGKVEFLKNKE